MAITFQFVSHVASAPLYDSTDWAVNHNASIFFFRVIYLNMQDVILSSEIIKFDICIVLYIQSHISYYWNILYY